MSDTAPTPAPDQLSEVDRLRLALAREKATSAQLRFEAQRRECQDTLDAWNKAQDQTRAAYHMAPGETVDLETGKINRLKTTAPSAQA